MELVETVIEPPTEEGRDPEPAVDDPEVEEMSIDTPPQNDMAEREKEGRMGDAAPGGALQTTPAEPLESTPAAEETTGSGRDLLVPPAKVAANPEQALRSCSVVGSRQAHAWSSGAIIRPHA